MSVAYSGIAVALRKISYTLIVIFACNILFSMQYPGICSSYEIKDNISYLIMSDVTSILSQSARPFIISNIMMHMLALIFSYFDKMRKEQDSKRMYEIITLFLMTTISITQSIIGMKYVDAYVSDYMKGTFFIYYSIINLIISLFIAWFNRQMLLNGMGHGVAILLSLKVINIYLKKHNMNGATHVLSMLGFYDYLFFILCFMFTICMEKFIIKLNICALSSNSYDVEKNNVSGYIEYKPTHSNIIANILTIQTTGLVVTMFALITSYNISIFETIGYYVDTIFNSNGLITNILLFVLRAFILFIYNYLYNYVSHNHAYKLNESLRKNLCCIPYIKPGSKTDAFVDSVIVRSSIISVFMTFGFLFVPYFLSHILPCKYIIVNGIDIMIIANSFMKIIEFMQSIYQYNSYCFDYSRLKNYKSRKFIHLSEKDIKQ